MPKKATAPGMAVRNGRPFLLTALIREINRPHRSAIHLQFEDIGPGVMPARIEPAT